MKPELLGLLGIPGISDSLWEFPVLLRLSHFVAFLWDQSRDTQLLQILILENKQPSIPRTVTQTAFCGLLIDFIIVLAFFFGRKRLSALTRRLCHLAAATHVVLLQLQRQELCLVFPAVKCATGESLTISHTGHTGTSVTPVLAS